MQPRDKFFLALLEIRSAATGAKSGSGGLEIVTAGDRLNADGVEAMRTALMACAQRGSWHYVLDLTKVKLIDAPGLGALVSALRTIRDLGGTIGLVTHSPRLQRVLELCARSRDCKIYNRISDAVKALTRAKQPKTAA